MRIAEVLHSTLPILPARLASRGRWLAVIVLHSAGRDFDSASLRLAERALARWPSHVMAVSPAQVREYHARVRALVPVSLDHNGMHPDISPRTVSAEWPGRLVTVGSLDAQKRIDVLVEGWRRAELPGTCCRWRASPATRRPAPLEGSRRVRHRRGQHRRRRGRH